MRIRLAGYQGAASVHTRGLHHLAQGLAAAGFDVDIEEDVTAQGIPAKTLFEKTEREPAQLCYMASGYLTARAPSLAVLDLPLTATDRLRAQEALDGLAVRTLDNELYQSTLRAFGFKPVVTDVRDLVQAVATGAVDAQENPLTNMLNFGLHKHHSHLSLTGHIYGAALLLCRASWFRMLPQDMADALPSPAAASPPGPT